jgi:Skp family chaperone for outer membrane proteins
MEKELEALKAENAALKTEAVEKDQLIKELMETIADKEASKGSGRPVFTVKGKKYELVVPKSSYQYKGKRTEITEKVLRENKALIAEIVEKGFGILTLI